MKSTARRFKSTSGKGNTQQGLRRTLSVLFATGATTLAASGSALALVMEPPDFSSTFPGHPSVVGETYRGFVGGDVDFFHYTGLNPGDLFDLALSLLPTNSRVDAARAFDASTFGTAISDTTANGNAEHLTGLVPLGGELSFRVSTPLFFEQYDVALNVSSSVSEPATVALLAAGLAGAFIRRRRRK
jgi:PEP-CTERM motif